MFLTALTSADSIFTMTHRLGCHTYIQFAHKTGHALCHPVFHFRSIFPLPLSTFHTLFKEFWPKKIVAIACDKPKIFDVTIFEPCSFLVEEKHGDILFAILGPFVLCVRLDLPFSLSGRIVLACRMRKSNVKTKT